MENFWYEVVIGALLIVVVIVGYVIHCQWPSNYVTIAVLNVGKGTSIYIESPTHHRVLIDGGPDHRILGEVRKFIPFYVHVLDTVFLTGAGDGRVAGLLDIENIYHIDQIIEGATTSSILYEEFRKSTVQKNIPIISAQQGEDFNFGDGVNIAVIFAGIPIDRNGRVVLKLTFGSSTALFTAGESAPFEDYILGRYGTSSVIADILTTQYNIARNTPSASFIKAVAPRWVAVSASSKKSLNIKTFSTKNTISLFTSQNGTIVFHCTKQACILVEPRTS